MSAKADGPGPMETDSQQPEATAQPPNEPTQPQTYRQVATEHIDTLSEINAQLPKMLTYFTTALSQLTNKPIRDHDAPDTLEARQEAFRKYAMYTGLSVNVIREELTHQINDLEKYKVIPKSHPKYTVAKRHGEKTESEVVDSEKSVKNGGYGEFDVGVLNARASSGQVGQEDALERLNTLLEELMRRQGSVNEEQMAVDG